MHMAIQDVISQTLFNINNKYVLPAVYIWLIE
ncbi:Uncharacterised protein [Yersinia frederiksenii]|nr:Uncharacterised protein [Yersinia frederiksenii]CNJ08598.1 Uncharacterised protein [Yersinia frederiksenii]CNK40233.1 Uncharacterised protein [Yersinia frederiksenii]